jgi:hypothetical protein
MQEENNNKTPEYNGKQIAFLIVLNIFPGISILKYIRNGCPVFQLAELINFNTNCRQDRNSMLNG